MTFYISCEFASILLYYRTGTRRFNFIRAFCKFKFFWWPISVTKKRTNSIHPHHFERLILDIRVCQNVPPFLSDCKTNISLHLSSIALHIPDLTHTPSTYCWSNHRLQENTRENSSYYHLIPTNKIPLEIICSPRQEQPTYEKLNETFRQISPINVNLPKIIFFCLLGQFPEGYCIRRPQTEKMRTHPPAIILVSL